MTAKEVIEMICPGSGDTMRKLELTYKKKPMPHITMSKGNMKLPTVFNPYAQPPPVPFSGSMSSMGMGGYGGMHGGMGGPPSSMFSNPMFPPQMMTPGMLPMPGHLPNPLINQQNNPFKKE